MGTEGDYHLYPESQVKHIIVLEHVITFYMIDVQFCITCYTEEEMHYEFQETTFLPKEDFAHFKASILEGAIGFNPLLCSERGDRPDKIRVPGSTLDAYRDYRSGTGAAD